jgi:hypothetical protein
MRISSTLAIAAALAATTACKKKSTEDTNKPVEGSSMAGSNMAGSNMAGSNMAGSNTMAAKPMTSDELVARYKECTTLIGSGDYDKFKSTCVADGYKSHDAMMGKDMSGDEMLAEMKKMSAGMSNTKFEPQLILVNGNTMAGVMLMSGDVKANSMMGPDGKPMGPPKDGHFSQLFFHRLKLNDAGKATDEWSVADMGTVMGQLGMMPPMPKGAPAPRPAATAMAGAPIVAVAANDDKEKANLDVVKKGNDAFNAHDAAGCTAVMADDAVESDQADEKDTTGKAAIEKGTGEFMKAVPDGKVEISEIWAAGDYVVAIGTFTGTMNKNPVTMEFSEVSQLKDGKIVKLWRFRNGMAAMAAMMGDGGAMPADKGKEPAKGGGAEDKGKSK